MTQGTLKFIETSFGQLAYRIDGEADGVPLILLQRYRGTMDDWDPKFISHLAAGKQLIRFDSVGVGRSGGDAPDNVAAMASAAVALIDALGFPKVDLLGWSLGGYVAQALTLSAPERVRRLVIAGSGPGGVTEAPPHPHVREIVVKEKIEQDDFMFLFFTETPTGRAAGLSHFERLKATDGPVVSLPTALQQRKAIVAWWQGTAAARPHLGEMTLPILVANGVADIMVPAYSSFLISQHAPNAKLVLYPDAGHGFLFQYIDAFVEEVRTFLSHA